MEENKLAQLKTKFTNWRASRNQGKGPIPDDLWEEVVHLYEKWPNLKIKKELKISSSRWSFLQARNKKIIKKIPQIHSNNFIKANIPMPSGIQVIIKFPSGVEVKVI